MSIPTFGPALLRWGPEVVNTAWRLGEVGEKLHQRFLERGDQEDLEQAIRCLFAATDKLSSDDPEAAGIWLNLGNAILDAFYWVERHPQTLEKAIETYRHAMKLSDRGFSRPDLILNGLGVALRELYLCVGDKANLHLSVEYFRQAVERVPEGEVENQATLLSNLGSALENLYGAEGRIVDLRQACDLHERAVRLSVPGTEVNLSALNNHGNALRLLFRRCRDLDLLDQAVVQFEEAVRQTTAQQGLRLASRLNNLANTLRDRCKLKPGFRLDVDRALSAHLKAVELARSTDAEYIKFLGNLGGAWQTRYDLFAQLEDLERAIDTHRSALALLEPTAPTKAAALQNLAYALSMRTDRTGCAADEEEARHLFSEAQSLGAESAPEAALTASRTWGLWAMRRENWSEAASAFQASLAVMNRVFQNQITRLDQELWLREVQGLPGQAAFCLAKLGETDRAAEELERGLARLLKARLGRASRGRKPKAETAEFQAHDAKPFCHAYLIATEVGGVALLGSGHRAGGIRSLWISDLQSTVIESKLEEIMTATDFSMDPSESPASLEQQQVREAWLWNDLLPWLARVAMEPILEEVSPTEHLILTPTGLLSSFPWHAMPRAGGKSYTLDSHCLSYVPSLVALEEFPLFGGIRTGSESILAVGDPIPSSQPRISWSAFEGELLGLLFGGDQQELLLEERATKSALMKSWAGATILHLSCHANLDPVSPAQSAFWLAGDELLALGELWDVETFSKLRLINLSSCNSAHTGLLTDEVLGLYAGFLEAGVPSIVASLGDCEERASALLMWKFYRELLGQEKRSSPAQALRTAQRWLRDARAEEFVRVCEHLRDLGLSDQSRTLLDEFLIELYLAEPESQPFSKPGYWAPFVYLGL